MRRYLWLRRRQATKPIGRNCGTYTVGIDLLTFHSMLIIRQEQIEILGAERMIEWFMGHLRRHFSVFLTWNDGALRTFVQAGISRAASYGIHSPEYVCRYLNVMAAHGEDFDMRADCRWWARKILGSARELDEARLSEFLSQTAVAVLRSRSFDTDESKQ